MAEHGAPTAADPERRRRGLAASGLAAAAAVLAALIGVSPAAAAPARSGATGEGPAQPAAAAEGTAQPGAGAGAPGAMRTVGYHGYQVRVPASWPVYNLASDPSRCVLFNQHAVYLGTPGADQRCPARAFGRTEALLVQPAPTGAAPAGTVVLPRDSAALPASAGTPAADAVSHTLRVAAPGPGVLVTASYGRDGPLMRSILAGAGQAGGTAPSAGSSPSAAASPSAAPSAPAAASPTAGAAAPSTAEAAPAASPAPASPGLTRRQGSGLGFDACTAPSVATMTSWLASPYRVIGTYLGGVNWACSYGNFSAAWVSQVAAEGWRFIPIWVGLQAPCSGISGAATIDPAQAAAEGQAEAASAVAAAQEFGYGAGSPLYFDMEGYNSANASCASAVLTFLGAWTQGLHAAGYRSGVYSSASSGISDLASQYANSAYPGPDDIWVADWNGDPVLTDSSVPAADWAGRRLHQYYGGHDETWGGATVNVDDNAIGGEVAGLPAGRAAVRPALAAEPDAVAVAPGAAAVVHLVIRGAGPAPASGLRPGLRLVRWQASPPAGLTVTPSRGIAIAWPGAGATVAVTVRPSASLAAGRYDVPVTASAGVQRLTETFELVSVVPQAAALPGPAPFVLYAADPASMAAAVAAGRRLALPAGDVTGDFQQAWTDLTGGKDLVLAVGQAAMNALYFNACGWANPAGAAAGSTPFYYLGEPLRQPPGADAFEPSDGAGPGVTAELTAQLMHYALAGTLPNEGARPIGPAPATRTCLGAADVPVP